MAYSKTATSDSESRGSLLSSPKEMYLSKLRAEECPEHFLTSASVGHLITLMLMKDRLPVWLVQSSHFL